MPQPSDFEPESDIFTTLTTLIGRFPVSDTVKVTRTAAEIASTIARQAQTLTALQRENAELCEQLAVSRADADAHRRHAERSDAEATRLRRVIVLLAEPERLDD